MPSLFFCRIIKSVTGATTAAASAGVGTGAGGCAARTAVLAGDILFAAALEVGFVPAAAFQAETRGGNFLFQFGLVAGRTNYQGFRTEFLQGFMFVTTGVALVFVNRHT